MKWLIAIALCGLAFFGIYLRSESEKAWNTSYFNARDAFERAVQYSDAGELLFQPPYLAFESALDVLDHQDAPFFDPWHVSSRIAVSMDLSGCKLLLDTYRIERHNAELADEIAHDGGHSDKKYLASALSTESELFSCQAKLRDDGKGLPE